MVAKHEGVPSDEMAVFRAYTDLINAEREAIWARHNTMVVANSLILSALTIAPAREWADLGLVGAGLIISVAWLFITKEGWGAIRNHVAIAEKFSGDCFRTLPNPFSEALYGRAQTVIYRLVLMVIALFVVMYLCIGFARLSG